LATTATVDLESPDYRFARWFIPDPESVPGLFAFGFVTTNRSLEACAITPKSTRDLCLSLDRRHAENPAPRCNLSSVDWLLQYGFIAMPCGVYNFQAKKNRGGNAVIDLPEVLSIVF